MEVGGRRCRVFCAGPRLSVLGDGRGDAACRVSTDGDGCPLLVQLVSERQGEDLEREAEMIAAAGMPFTLVAVPVRDWELELMPWAEPAVSKRPEVGTGAGETLRYLMEALLPAVLPPPPAGTPPCEGGELSYPLPLRVLPLEKGESWGEPGRAMEVPACEFCAAPRCEGEEPVRATKVPACEFCAAPLAKGSCRAATEGFAPIILGGYSLAGLFALWAACQTDRFGAVVAGSPSLWAGDWPGYAAGHAMQARQVYLSLGDREERSRNKTFARVGDRIREEHRRLQQQLGEENTTLVWEEGGHFADPAARMARGFVWCLALKTRMTRETNE